MIVAEARKAEIKAESSSGNMAGDHFDDSRRTNRLNQQHSLRKVMASQGSCPMLDGG